MTNLLTLITSTQRKCTKKTIKMKNDNMTNKVLDNDINLKQKQQKIFKGSEIQ